MLDPRKPPSTLAEMAQRSFVQHAARPYLGVKEKGQSEYRYAQYAAVGARVRNMAGALLELGLERGQRAAILAENCPEWVVADLACQALGVITVPLYSTLPANQIQTILSDSGAGLMFVSDAKQRQKITEIQDQLPGLKHVVVTELRCDGGEGDLYFNECERRGEEYLAANPGRYESTWPAALPTDVATIIYTSGTTGEPKGVMLTHRNILANLEAITAAIHLDHEHSFLSFLPLAHVYERTAGYYLPTRLGASIAYCESLFTVDKNMREVAPTIMFGVPRLFQAIREKLFHAAQAMPPGQKSKYLDALALAQKAGAHAGGVKDAPRLSLIEGLKYKVYEAKVYSLIRQKFGGRLKVFVAGGAPLSPELGALFLGAGIEILEGYGLSETSPVIAVNRPGEIHLGTVGEALENLEVRIEDDGEISVHGPSVMKGYWNKPDASAEVLSQDGWFHTGDIGELNDGILKITDRKKDLLVLANGKNVAPAPIEAKLDQSPFIEQVVLVGDKLKTVAALIVPNREELDKWAKEQGADGEGDQLLKHPKVIALYKAEVEKYATDLADYERIKKIALLEKPFSVESGEMTPTLKIKRRVVTERYGSLVGGE